jgi:DNA-binding Xre family transcriptional regulator
VTVDYEWRLRLLMAEHGMFKASDLQPRLAEHGIELSASQVWRLVTGRPERLNLRVLVVLCEILDCEPGELVRRTSVAAPVVKEPASGRAISKDLRPQRVQLKRPADGT